MKVPVLGLYKYCDEMLNAAEKIQNAGHKFETITPVPIVHELEAKFGERKDVIRFVTFTGAVTGFFVGIIVALGTAAMYPLPRGGRSIFPFTPTMLVSYELTILFGVLSTVAAFLVLTKLPSFKKKYYDEAVNIESFGLLVEVDSEATASEVENIMKEFDVEEVKRLEAI